ncbi:MAG: GNAT family protein [Bacteroidota bacterium]
MMFPLPEKVVLENSQVRLEPLDPGSHAEDLFDAAAEEPGITFHHMFFGPFSDLEGLKLWMEEVRTAERAVVYAVFSKRLRKYVGSCAIMNTDPAHGSSEIGSIWYSPSARRTEINTNVSFLLLEYLFERLHYTRVVWKCDDLNTTSKSAAVRLGFAFEGVSRKHMLIKGRVRNTAWYAMIDEDWPGVKIRLLGQLRWR